MTAIEPISRADIRKQTSRKMDDAHPTVDEAVTTVLASRIDDRCVNAMNRFASSSTSAESFVRTLVSRSVESGKSIDFVLPEMQQFFERIADYSTSTACVFMAHLWPIAKMQIGMHDVCDSIDLWLANNTDSHILHHLRHIASSAENESIREHFRQKEIGRL